MVAFSAAIYGTGCGTVFKITPAGALTTLHTFTGADGGYAVALLQASDGNFYGTTTLVGGSNLGTIFKITPAGALTTLHTFTLSEGGGDPMGLMQAADGNFYGTTFGGGNYRLGTVFRMTPAGTLTTLASVLEGHPDSGVIQAGDGNFYGTTSTEFGGGGPSAIYKMTPTGELSDIYTFCTPIHCPQGNDSESVLVQGTDGNLYGTTVFGGTNADGTVFQITTAGTFTLLHTFDGTDGCNGGQMNQATDGNFYGSTGCGPNGNGTIFRLSMGLGQFVTTNPTTGKAGTKVGILGTNLKGATAVSFNGTPARFSVAGKTVIVATVPVGATTGLVTVTTPSGTLTSNAPFQIAP